MTLLVPRVRNEVLFVTQVINSIYFAWQMKYFVRLAGICLLSVNCKCYFEYYTDYK